MQRLIFLTLFLFVLRVHADPCDDMEVWDYSMAMCAPLPMTGMAMRMFMIHGNSFFMQSFEEKPRGRNGFSVPNFVMADMGTSFDDIHYFNLSFMGTLEKWTFPYDGTPELLQVGEERGDGTPFLDAQHPHSSPVMGLTLSDTIRLDEREKDHLKIWFAPRGESTDGPVAFMHRPTGEINPQAPLGHHVGQDVGHITSTVLGASLHLSDTTLQFSTFNGTEPEPTKVDLPVNPLNSYSARVIQAFSESWYAMASAAYVDDPEAGVAHLWRYSASLYFDGDAGDGWQSHNAFIWGKLNLDGPDLNSLAEEFSLSKNSDNYWGRVEVLQRTPADLEIASVPDLERGRWITAATLGYTRHLLTWENLELGLGGALTKYFLPGEFHAAYGGDPWSARVFLRLSGMKMW